MSVADQRSTQGLDERNAEAMLHDTVCAGRRPSVSPARPVARDTCPMFPCRQTARAHIGLTAAMVRFATSCECLRERCAALTSVCALEP
jgi:hypothetical protein